MPLIKVIEFNSLLKIRTDIHSVYFLIFSVCCIFMILSGGCATKMSVEDPASVSESFQSEIVNPEKFMTEGREYYQIGDLDKAIVNFEQALDLYKKEKDSEGQFDALLQLAQAYRAVGDFEKALEVSIVAEKIGRESENDMQIARALNIISSVYLGVGRNDEARKSLDQCLSLAEEFSDPALKAAALNNLGNLYTAEARYDNAYDAYMGSALLSKETDNKELRAISLANAMNALIRNGEYETSRYLLKEALELTRLLDDSQNKVFSLINIGLSCQLLSVHIPALHEILLKNSEEVLIEAAVVAENIGSKRALSYAKGHLGGLYEKEYRYLEALKMTRIAIFRAQEINAPESLFKWQWQVGRIFTALGNIEEAISQYRNTIYTLQTIQQEKTSCYSQYPSNIRESITTVSFELVDILLKRASESHDKNKIGQYLTEAREVAELRKIFELRNYYRDDCVDAARSGSTKLDEVSRTAVVVYPIVLKDRTEILYSLPSGLKRFAAKIDKETLTREVLSYRRLLEKRTTREYLPHAQNLYDWLIRPMEEDLRAAGIDTMVFVPDGPLRTIPMSALYDGNQFLIEKYALAITPGLDLTDPKPIEKEGREVLIFALTQTIGGFAPLPYITSELDSIQSLYKTKILLNQDFQVANIERELSKERYTILHIASHAQFEKNVGKTFLLAYDNKMTIENLNNYIGFLKFREEPLELLTLSACETAAGDDKAALGLAGIAIKAGARSALATLWHINDLASSILISDFYLRLPDQKMSRAKALQEAQLKLLKDRRFQHPGYWSPFLLISDWL